MHPTQYFMKGYLPRGYQFVQLSRRRETYSYQAPLTLWLRYPNLDIYVQSVILATLYKYTKLYYVFECVCVCVCVCDWIFLCVYMWVRGRLRSNFSYCTICLLAQGRNASCNIFRCFIRTSIAITFRDIVDSLIEQRSNFPVKANPFNNKHVDNSMTCGFSR